MVAAGSIRKGGPRSAALFVMRRMEDEADARRMEEFSGFRGAGDHALRSAARAFWIAPFGRTAVGHGPVSGGVGGFAHGCTLAGRREVWGRASKRRTGIIGALEK